MVKVLIVDDSRTARFRLTRLVRECGHEVVTANDGETALELAASMQPDLILMDIVMPGMNGYQAKRELARNEATRHIPVIFVSARSEDTDKAWGMRQGARDYVTKPVNANRLRSAIGACTAS